MVHSETTEAEVVRDVVQSALTDGWEVAAVDSDAVVVEHTGQNRMTDASRVDSTLRAVGYSLKYVASPSPDVQKLVYTLDD